MQKIVCANGYEKVLESLGFTSDGVMIGISVDNYTTDVESFFNSLTAEALADVKIMDNATVIAEFFNPVIEDGFRVVPADNKYSLIINFRQRNENEIKVAAAESIIDDLDDETAAKVKCLYSSWKSLIGKEVKLGKKFVYNGALFKVAQPTLTVQEQWIPGSVGTESLYTCIDEFHAGTVEDPIPYSGNMELEKEKYYIQDEQLYYCFNSSVNAVHDPLSKCFAFIQPYYPPTEEQPPVEKEEIGDENIE